MTSERSHVYRKRIGKTHATHEGGRTSSLITISMNIQTLQV